MSCEAVFLSLLGAFGRILLFLQGGWTLKISETFQRTFTSLYIILIPFPFRVGVPDKELRLGLGDSPKNGILESRLFYITPFFFF